MSAAHVHLVLSVSVHVLWSRRAPRATSIRMASWWWQAQAARRVSTVGGGAAGQDMERGDLGEVLGRTSTPGGRNVMDEQVPSTGHFSLISY